MQDRFKFRVWDKRLNRYLGKDDPTQMLLENGNLAYLDDEGMKFYEVEFCTGLKDKNGKFIYEGDILDNISIDEQYDVRWDEDTARFCCITDNEIYDFDFDVTAFEVIGNIHENADLLGE